VTAGAFKPGAFLEHGKCLRQAVCVEARLDALLAGKERIAAVHAIGIGGVGLQFLAQFDVHKNCTSVLALGHVGQQADLIFHAAV